MSVPSLRLAMDRVLSLVTAELLQFDLLGHRLLVFRGAVVPVFALGTLKRDDFSTCARHGSLLLMLLYGALDES